MSISPVDSNSSFYIVLHDVTPRFSDAIHQVVDLLSPLVGNNIAASVVPQWHGDSLEEFTPEFVNFVKSAFSEISLHGYYHKRDEGGGFRSWLTNNSDEFNGLNLEQTNARLEKGLATLQQIFNLTPRGFISPTFAAGKLEVEQLATQGIEFAVWMRSIIIHNQPSIPIATWCWDVSHFKGAGHVGHFYGNMRMLLYRNLLPCLAIHPVDIERGFSNKIKTLVELLLQQGRKPILLDRHTEVV